MRTPALLTALLAALGLHVASPVQAQNAAVEVHSRSIDIAPFVAEAALRFGLPEAWIYAVMRTESAGRIGAVSSAGAMGLMQLMPGTWARQRARFGLGADPFDPRDNIIAGTSYLREMYDRYGAPGFLAAYNAGPGRYEDWRNRGRLLPAETRSYVAKIAPILHIGDAPTVASRASPVQPLRLSWTRGALFAQRSDAVDAAPEAIIDDASAAPPPAASRPPGGLFAPVPASRPR